jgi:hypothetical protein
MKYNETVHHLFIYSYFKKTYDSVRKEVLYNILIDLGVPMKLVRLIKMCLSETYSKVRIGKHLSESFPIQNGLKKEMFYHYCFPSLLWNMPLGRCRKTRLD